MNDVDFGALVVRMVVSLGVVLALLFGAYAVMRRRRAGGPVAGGGVVASLGRRLRGGRLDAGTARRDGLTVVGRAGLGRTSSAVAVQFADRVLLIGVNDQQAPAVLAELGLDDWTAATVVPSTEPAAPSPSGAAGPAGADVRATAGPGSARLLDALRDATVRRG